MFSNGDQTPTYGNEKTASQIIIELQNKNAQLRLALGKLLKMCDNCKIQEKSPIWMQVIGIGKEIMESTK